VGFGTVTDAPGSDDFGGFNADDNIAENFDAYDDKWDEQQLAANPNNPYLSLGQDPVAAASENRWNTWEDAPPEDEVSNADGIVEDWTKVQDPWRMSTAFQSMSMPDMDLGGSDEDDDLPI